MELPPDLPDFIAETAEANGTRLAYVRGGEGPLMVLIHGFPEDWYEWRPVMERLARCFTVVAVDLRGVGGSDAPDDGYDAATMADDVHELVEHLALGPAHVAGHDIGGWVGFALAIAHPETVSSVAVLETILPGIGEPEIDVSVWHGEFHMIPDLPEALVTDRQEIYFRHFFDIGTVGDDAITDDAIAHYVDAYTDPASLRAAFEMYRALPANIAFNSEHRGPVDVPLLLVGGENVFGSAMTEIAATLRDAHGWTDVAVEIIANGQHYIVEERPDDVAELIERHATR